ncbi:MAG: hypothetical protein CO093_10020 [Alphaproteobacteria bacterium CG_4_9_14_3_um_filter_47_13]|nr:MAG: hypothetical protein CO093_10020 [Alphaproteobacteria bacterium CG_4_9_14_3_um_filter_47_13]
MKNRYKILSVFSVVILTIGFSFYLLPWKMLLAQRLQILLEDKGFQNVRLTLSDLNLHSAKIRNISIGDDTPLLLKDLTLLYSPRALWKGNLQELTVSGLSLEMYKDKTRWRLQGYNASSAEGKFYFPVTAEQLSFLPFDHLALGDSQIRIVTDPWQIKAPLEFRWHKIPVPEVVVKSENPSFEMGKMKAHIASAEINAAINQQKEIWQGFWSLKDVQLKTENAVIPALDLKGTLEVDARTLTLAGRMESKESAGYAEFTLGYSLENSEKTVLTLTQAALPWQGGMVMIGKTEIPLTDKKAVKVLLQVKKVSVDSFLQSLTGKKVSATGVVSGTLPLIIGRDGTVFFEQGILKADGPGTITLPEDLIPGDHEQVVLTREILKDFQYDTLSLSIRNDTGNKMSVLAAIEGKNPAVMKGRAVQLNVRINGDLLDLIRQNVILFTDPQQILDQNHP